MIKITDNYAFIENCFKLVVLNEEKKGYRVSEKAYKNLKKSNGGDNVYSTIFNNEIVWVSDEEFKENKMTEIAI